MITETKPIGAKVTYAWKDTREVTKSYISFGEYDEVSNTDGLGIADDFIFFYTSNLDTLESLKSEDNGEDWVLLSIEEVHFA